MSPERFNSGIVLFLELFLTFGLVLGLTVHQMLSYRKWKREQAAKAAATAEAETKAKEEPRGG